MIYEFDRFREEPGSELRANKSAELTCSNPFPIRYNCSHLDCTDEELWRSLPVGGSLELVRVLWSDALSGKQFCEGGIVFDLSRHERVELSRRTRIFYQLFLHDLLNLLAAMGDAMDKLGNLGGNDNNAVLISNDGITGADNCSTEADYIIALPGLHSGRTLAGSCSVGEARETVVNNLVSVADGSIGD